jgi:hypothetical protein
MKGNPLFDYSNFKSGSNLSDDDEDENKEEANE